MKQKRSSPAVFSPDPWLRIGSDGRVSLLVDRTEMGQGVVTALAMLVAEELEVAPEQVVTQWAPADEAYANRWLGSQLTGGSTSVRAAWQPLREAAASARERLVSAAAAMWEVDREDCYARDGAVHGPSGLCAGYGALAARAEAFAPPQEVRLKPPESFTIIGRSRTGLDMADKIAGRSLFGVDIAVPGALKAVVARCPVFGGKAGRVRSDEAMAVRGVKAVVGIDSGVAVLADSVWSARAGRDRLEIAWEEGGMAWVDSEAIHRRLRRLACREGDVTQVSGNVTGELSHAGTVIEAVYETPYLAHAAMEPMNCTARVESDGCDLWVPTQDQRGAQETAAELTGLPLHRVRVHTTFAGGAFGRRMEQDVVVEAVQLASAMATPVQVVWSLEDDLGHDFYRPANCNHLRAVLAADGTPTAWDQCTAGPPLSLGGVDIPYRIPNVREEQAEFDAGIPTGAWRSVEASQNAFAVECFIDELAHAAGEDPYFYRRKLMTGSPRHRAVLDTAARLAGWGEPVSPGRGMGIAVYHCYGSWVAQVAEVSIGPEEIRVHRVACAVDCGMVVNPDTVVAQMEGGIVFGLTAALKGEITIRDGSVEQRGFDDYPLLTFAECPEIDVVIVPSSEPPGGVGEPGVPPIAPAVANAVFAATGKRIRRLPLGPRLNRGG